MLAASLSSAALASRLRLSGTLALDPDLGVRLQGFQSLARELVQENAPSASVDEVRAGGSGHRRPLGEPAECGRGFRILQHLRSEWCPFHASARSPEACSSHRWERRN